MPSFARGVCVAPKAMTRGVLAVSDEPPGDGPPNSSYGFERAGATTSATDLPFQSGICRTNPSRTDDVDVQGEWRGDAALASSLEPLKLVERAQQAPLQRPLVPHDLL
jgi:hypothetical protein